MVSSLLDKIRIPFGAIWFSSDDKIRNDSFAREQLRITGVFLTPRGALVGGCSHIQHSPEKCNSDKGSAKRFSLLYH